MVSPPSPGSGDSAADTEAELPVPPAASVVAAPHREGDEDPELLPSTSSDPDVEKDPPPSSEPAAPPPPSETTVLAVNTDTPAGAAAAAAAVSKKLEAQYHHQEADEILRTIEREVHAVLSTTSTSSTHSSAYPAGSTVVAAASEASGHYRHDAAPSPRSAVAGTAAPPLVQVVPAPIPSPPPPPYGAAAPTAVAAAVPSSPSFHFSSSTSPRVDHVASFTMSGYRELHQRSFRTRSEELSFLRHHFVSSRKRLQYVYQYVKEMKAALLAKSDEVAVLQQQLQKSRAAAASAANNTARGATGDGHSTVDGTTTSGSGYGSGGGIVSVGKAKSSALWLYAASRKQPALATAADGENQDGSLPSWRQGAARRCGGACEQVIQALRRNLASRDNDLTAMQLDNSGLSNARRLMEKELRTVKAELHERTDERNGLQLTLADKAKQIDTLIESQHEEQTNRVSLEQEVEKLRKEKAVLEVLLGGAEQQKGQRTRGAGRRAVKLLDDDDDDEEEAESLRMRRGKQQSSSHSGSSSAALTAARRRQDELQEEVDRLEAQVQRYRVKWLQAQEALDAAPLPIIAPCLAPSPSPAAAVAAAAALRSSTELQQQQHDAITRDLSRECEELRRNQRRLEREVDTAKYQEECATRQHREEQRQLQQDITRLQEEIRRARDQVNRVTGEKETVCAELRSMRDDKQLLSVVQSQNDALRERVTALTTEVAEVQAKERSLATSVQGEVASKLHALHEKSLVERQLDTKAKEVAALEAEVQVQRKRVGAAEGRIAALVAELEAMVIASSAGGSSSKEESGARVVLAGSAPAAGLDYSPQALYSEMKGYAALMALTTRQQDRLVELEQKLQQTTQEIGALKVKEELTSAAAAAVAAAAGGTTAREQHDGALHEPTASLVTLRTSLLREISTLQDTLKDTRCRQHILLQQWERLQQENDTMRSENKILATGAERLMSRVSELKKRNRSISSSARQQQQQLQQQQLAKAATTPPPPPHSTRHHVHVHQRPHGKDAPNCPRMTQVHVSMASIPRQRLTSARAAAADQQQLEVQEHAKKIAAPAKTPPPPPPSSTTTSPHRYVVEGPQLTVKVPPPTVASTTASPAPTVAATTTSTAPSSPVVVSDLERVKREVLEYEKVMRLLDSTGKLDHLLQEALMLQEQQRRNMKKKTKKMVLVKPSGEEPAEPVDLL